jgi:cytochrome P450
VTGKLRARWIGAGREDQAIDLLADLMRYTVDVTTCLAFGRNLNTLEQGDLDVIQQHLNVIFPAVLRRTFAPVDIEHWLRRPALRRRAAALQKAVQGLIREARQQLERTPELAQRPENLLQALVAACDSEGDRARLGDEELSGNVLTMLLAGEDTTANTLGWLIWLLHNHPAEWERARSEVDAKVEPGQLLGRLRNRTRADCGGLGQSVEHAHARRLDHHHAARRPARRRPGARGRRAQHGAEAGSDGVRGATGARLEQGPDP